MKRNLQGIPVGTPHQVTSACMLDRNYTLGYCQVPSRTVKDPGQRTNLHPAILRQDLMLLAKYIAQSNGRLGKNFA